MPEVAEKSDKKSVAWQNDQRTKPAKSRTFEKIQTNFKSLEKGESVEGTLIAKESQNFPGQSEPVGRYKIETTADSGELRIVTILGSVQLDDLLNQVQEGSYLRITFTGNTKSRSGRNVKTYDVEVATD